MRFLAHRGTVYTKLATVEQRADNLRRAIECYRAALMQYTPQTAPLNYAATQRNLGVAFLLLADLAGAIAAWREAERYYRLMDAVADADRILRLIEDTEQRLRGEH